MRDRLSPHFAYVMGQLMTALLALVLFDCRAARSESRETSRIIGGRFEELSYGPYALILTPLLYCSGTLVGPSLVLTAAHCIVDELTAADYSVMVGGEIVAVESIQRAEEYNPEGDAVINAPYDLGMITLTTPIESVPPVPILSDGPVKKGTEAEIFGYGRNEAAWLEPWNSGKHGRMKVGKVSGGIFYSSAAALGASTCPGDSGGPAVFVSGVYEGVIGVLSVGTNSVVSGRCYLGDSSGLFAHVDLQSESSQGFLAQFDGLLTISAPYMRVNTAARSARSRLQRGARARTLAAVTSQIQKALIAINLGTKSATGTRATSLSAAKTLLNAARRARTIPAKRAKIEAATVVLDQLIALGVD